MNIQAYSGIKEVKVSAVIRKKDGRVIDCGVISTQRKSLIGRILYPILSRLGLSKKD